MIARRDLAALLDDVSRRACAVEIVVDNTLEQSISATVRTDRMADARAVITRYADSMSAALEAALVEAATWINAQPGFKTPIVIGTTAPTIELIASLRALLEQAERGRGVVDPRAVARGRAAIAVVLGSEAGS